MFPNIFSKIVFYSLVSDWLLRLFKSSEISESPKSVVHETEDHRKEKQSCHAQSAYPQVSEEAHTPKSPEVESAKEGVPTLVQPEGTKADNASRLKRKLQSVTLSRDKLITENLLLKEKMSSMERAHADHIQAMTWIQEDLENKFTDEKLQEDLKSEQVLAQYRLEISQLRELTSQLTKENHDLGVELVESRANLESVSLCLKQREDQIKSLEKENIDLNHSCDSAKSKFCHANRQWRGACTARSDLQRKNENLNDQVARLVLTVDKEVAARVEMEQVHSNELNLLRDFNANRNSKREIEVNELRDRIQDLEEENEELMAEVDELEDASYKLPDLYATLGFKEHERKTASNEDIKKAYKTKQKEYHPNRVSEYDPNNCQRAVDRAKKRSQEVLRAKYILGNELFRPLYDHWINMTDLNNAIQWQIDYNNSIDPEYV